MRTYLPPQRSAPNNIGGPEEESRTHYQLSFHVSSNEHDRWIDTRKMREHARGKARRRETSWSNRVREAQPLPTESEARSEGDKWNTRSLDAQTPNHQNRYGRSREESNEQATTMASKLRNRSSVRRHVTTATLSRTGAARQLSSNNSVRGMSLRPLLIHLDSSPDKAGAWLPSKKDATKQSVKLRLELSVKGDC